MPRKPGTFARFFCAVPGRLVSRYGTARTTAAGGYREAHVFGGRRPPMSPDVAGRPMSRGSMPVELDCDTVTAISHSEAARYRREYDRAVREGSLIEVKEEKYLAQLRADDKRAKKLTADQAKAKAKEAALAEEQDAARAKKRQRSGTAAAGGTGSADGQGDPSQE